MKKILAILMAGAMTAAAFSSIMYCFFRQNTTNSVISEIIR